MARCWSPLATPPARHQPACHDTHAIIARFEEGEKPPVAMLDHHVVAPGLHSNIDATKLQKNIFTLEISICRFKRFYFHLSHETLAKRRLKLKAIRSL